MYICVYIYIYMCIHVYTYIYMQGSIYTGVDQDKKKNNVGCRVFMVHGPNNWVLWILVLVADVQVCVLTVYDYCVLGPLTECTFLDSGRKGPEYLSRRFVPREITDTFPGARNEVEAVESWGFRDNFQRFSRDCLEKLAYLFP